MNIDPTNATGGPRTQHGKARSAQNSLKQGLFAAHDFIREGEEDEYATTVQSLMFELAPEGVLELTFATEIIGATWRLRRCRLVEEAFGAIDDLDFDPMTDERTEKQQRSVDRARSQSHLILRRSLAELRKFQTGRMQNQENDQPAPPPTPAQSQGFAGMDALMALADKQLAQRYRDAPKIDFPSLIPHQADPKTRDQWSGSFGIPGVPQPTPTPATPAPAPGSFCKTTPATPASPKTTPRNAQCPCGSGMKFKRCCAGKEVNRAA